MKMTRFTAVICIVALALSLNGCALFDTPQRTAPGEPHASAAGIADRYTSNSDKIVDFSRNITSDFEAANGYGNGGMFGCAWEEANASVGGGVMNMSVTADNGGYKGAEYRSRSSYTYGYYSVAMKAARCSGVISSFFTYTNRPKWDEIDIEFLGNDTTRVQFNYYTNGVGGHEYVHDLGFDASQGVHEYGFDWQEDYIVWYVDGRAIYKADADIPSAPQKIMMNVWNAVGLDQWCGAFDPSGLPATATYLWIAYKPNPAAPVEPTRPSEPSDPTEPSEPTKPVEPSEPSEPAKPIAPDRITADGAKIADFTYGGSGAFWASDGWSNGGMFDCTWRSSNVAFSDGTMNISVTREGGGYAGGEYRSNAQYSFGYYSASIKPAKCSGVVSSLFTYTSDPQWDEIDIEFLGNDTTKVQFNYFTNGVGNHEYLYDLGFDASQGFHEYGFLWRSDSIIWYVDGKAVYKATENIPQHAGKIMTNVWNGTGVDDWIGAFDPSGLPVTARYKWIGYSAD